MPVIGFLAEGTPDSEPDALPAFHQGLREAGYVEGQNVQIDYRWSGAQCDLLLALTADLVRRKVTVIYSARGSAVAQADRRVGVLQGRLSRERPGTRRHLRRQPPTPRRPA
jgi:putative ABC transport system substrate-binding protein